METTVEQLIKERAYASLTSEELQSVSELCETEEEFQNMKQFFLELDGVAASDKTIVNPEVKQSLDSIFSAKFPGIHANWTAPETTAEPAAPVIPLHQRTWVRVAAVGLLVLGTAPFWNMLRTTDAPKEQAFQTAKNETPQAIDTRQPEKKTDTVNSNVRDKKTAEAPQIAGLYESDQPASAAYIYEDVAGDIKVTALDAASGSLTSGVTYTWTASSLEVNMADGFSLGSHVRPAASSFLSEGKLADLNPNGYMVLVGENNALSLAEQPDDLLDLLSPAF